MRLKSEPRSEERFAGEIHFCNKKKKKEKLHLSTSSYVFGAQNEPNPRIVSGSCEFINFRN